MSKHRQKFNGQIKKKERACRKRKIKGQCYKKKKIKGSAIKEQFKRQCQKIKGTQSKKISRALSQKGVLRKDKKKNKRLRGSVKKRKIREGERNKK